jgi:nucleoside-diphosphate-sugar epimerase
MSSRILITGISGFIGSHVFRTLSREPKHGGIRHLAHKRSTVEFAGDAFTADLTKPETLHGICQGIDTVIHLASYVGNDPDRSDAVNHLGTKALVAEATRAGVQRFIYLSTAAVYGPATCRGSDETAIVPAPASAVSTARLAAERCVLAIGGVALRPMFVYGDGDLWFIPSLVNLLRRMPLLVNGGESRISVIAVDDLADAIATLALLPPHTVFQPVYHVNHPQPVLLHELVTAVTTQLGLSPIHDSVDFEELRANVNISEAMAHQLALVASDRWFDNSAIWRLLNNQPTQGFAASFARYAGWYHDQLRESSYSQ